MYITKQGRSKGTAYESGVRVSMAIRGPGIKANTQSDELVHSVDLFSTVLELAGLDVPKMVSNKEGNGMVELDAISLTPVLFKGAKGLRDPRKGYLLSETVNFYKEKFPIEVGVRNATYKVICDENAKTENCVFYNLVDDPIEEYPLEKPDSCTNYENGTWTPSDPEWNFCQLQEVIAKKSTLANPPEREIKAFQGPAPEEKK